MVSQDCLVSAIGGHVVVAAKTTYSSDALVTAVLVLCLPFKRQDDSPCVHRDVVLAMDSQIADCQTHGFHEGHHPFALGTVPSRHKRDRRSHAQRHEVYQELRVGRQPVGVFPGCCHWPNVTSGSTTAQLPLAQPACAAAFKEDPRKESAAL